MTAILSTTIITQALKYVQKNIGPHTVDGKQMYHGSGSRTANKNSFMESQNPIYNANCILIWTCMTGNTVFGLTTTLVYVRVLLLTSSLLRITDLY